MDMNVSPAFLLIGCTEMHRKNDILQNAYITHVKRYILKRER